MGTLLERGGAAVEQAGLVTACWAMAVVFALMFVVFLRSGRRGYGVAMLPLFLPPLMYIFSHGLGRRLPLFGLPMYESMAVYNMAGGLLACLLLGISVQGIENKRSRQIFFLSCAGFVVILTGVLVTHCLERGQG